MNKDNNLVTLLLPTLLGRKAPAFNVFDVMHHGPQTPRFRGLSFQAMRFPTPRHTGAVGLLRERATSG